MKKILIVDDSKCFADIMRAALEGSCDVRAAATGKEALQAVAGDPPDLVLLDVQMPDMDGPEVAQKLLSSAPDIPVILITAVEYNRAMESFASSLRNVRAFISKLSPVEQIIAKITQILAAPRGKV